MSAISVHPLASFRDNYIWLLHDNQSDGIIVVDPGEAEGVIHYLESQKRQLKAILITHRHHDHIGGIAELTERHSVPVFGPNDSTIKGLTRTLGTHESLIIDAHFPTFRILNVPGHTAQHLAYLVEDKLFCGDTLFAGGCGRILGGSFEALFRSLCLIKGLAPNTAIYCAHEYTLANLAFAQAVEPENTAISARKQKVEQQRKLAQPSIPSLLAEELATNPFLRCDTTAVKEQAEAYIGHALNTEQAVFTVLRQWKDSF